MYKIFFSLASVCLLFTSCSEKPPEEKELRIAFHARPAAKDPRFAADLISTTLVGLLYDGLYREGGEGLVEEETMNGLTVTYKLKTPTARLFVESWENPLFNQHLFSPIESTSALDDCTLQITLKKETPHLRTLLAFPSFFASPGPFILTHEDASALILKKNPHYWNASAIEIDQITIYIIPDETTALSLFEQGKLDWIGTQLSPLPSDAKITKTIPTLASTFCTFNTTKGPFNDRDVRLALSYAIDREKIVEHVALHQTAAESMLPPQISSATRVLYNPELARRLLQNKELPEITLLYKPGTLEKSLATALAAEWKEVLGLDVRIVPLEAKILIQKLQEKDYQMALTFWIAQFDDPISILDRFTDPSYLKNYPGFDDPLYNEAIITRDYKTAEERFLDEMPLTPLYHWRSPVLEGPRIAHTQETPSGGILFERFDMKTITSP
jgi:ABC-type oligopeptide transport system substrate-binding subunit